MKKRLIIIISLVILVIILLLYYNNKIVTRNTIKELVHNNKMINILIACSNVYNNNMHRFYSILTVNPDNKEIGITFIPPSQRIDLSGLGKRFYRIDEVDLNDFKRLSAALGRDLRIKILYFVELYSPDVERVVDLIEGIDLYVLDQVKGIHGVEFGLNYFDGKKILSYINSTEKNSIFKKYDRIQDIILTLYYNRNKYKRFLNLGFISESVETIKTNLLPQELFSIAMLLFNSSDLFFIILPGRFNEEGYYFLDDIAYKIYREEFLKRILFSNKDKISLKVRILNGTTVTGLARKMRTFLVKEDINVVEFGTSSFPSIDTTVIINRKGNIIGLRSLSELIGVNKIYHVIDSNQLNDILIIVGKDYIK